MNVRSQLPVQTMWSVSTPLVAISVDPALLAMQWMAILENVKVLHGGTECEGGGGGGGEGMFAVGITAPAGTIWAVNVSTFLGLLQ